MKDEPNDDFENPNPENRPKRLPDYVPEEQIPLEVAIKATNNKRSRDLKI